MMRVSRIQSLAYGSILILLSVSSSVCIGQSIPAQDISSWWTNLADAPLQISLSPKKDRLFISNTSDRNARRFRLGCATTLSPVLKIGRKFDWEISDSLQAATEGRYRFETLGDKYNDPNVCKSGKLILLATEFDDGAFFRADLKHERRDSQSIAPTGTKIQSSFGYPFNARVTEVLDGCTVKIKIEENRTGEIDGQGIEIPSSVPEYNGTKLLRLINVRCEFANNELAARSRDRLAHLTANKLVEIVFRNWEQINKPVIIGRLTVLENSKDASFEQLKNGMAKFRQDKRETFNDSDHRKYKEAYNRSQTKN